MNISFAGVIGFVLISGYYGIRFTWFKVLKLETTALFCAAFVTFLGEAVFHCSPSPLTFASYLASAISIWKGYWFIHAYVLLMCLAPLVPEVGSRVKRKDDFHSRAIEKVKRWLDGVTRDRFAAALEKLVAEKRASGEYCFKSEDEVKMTKDGAMRFFDNFAANLTEVTFEASSKRQKKLPRLVPLTEAVQAVVHHQITAGSNPQNSVMIANSCAGRQGGGVVCHSIIQAFKHSNIQDFLPLILAIYGWSFLTLIPGIQAYIPRTPGLEAFGGVTLFAVYLVGRLYRAYDGDRLSPWLVYPLATIGGVLAAVSGKSCLDWVGAFARYNSPTLLCFSIGIFYAFRRFGGSSASSRAECNNSNILNSTIQTFLRILLPSILPVYLLHCNPYGYKFIAYLEAHLPLFHASVLPNLQITFAFFLLSLVVFISSFILDIPRRLLVAAVNGIWYNTQKLDDNICA